MGLIHREGLDQYLATEQGAKHLATCRKPVNVWLRALESEPETKWRLLIGRDGGRTEILLGRTGLDGPAEDLEVVDALRRDDLARPLVVVVDEDGQITGTKGDVLETFGALSKATDAKTAVSYTHLTLPTKA